MLLLQKQPNFGLSQAVVHTHRRHPSAPPAVVVQPTRTPGLLSIARPPPQQPKGSPQRILPSTQRKNGQKPRLQPLVARAPALLNPAEITEKRPALAVLQPPASPSPVRGRVTPKDKAKANRSASRRQPSPPVEVQPHRPSQAEDPSHNPFDPFLEPNTKPPAAVPVPSTTVPRPQHQHQLARSAPTASNMRKNAKPTRFPICDDMTDAGDISETETPPPQTPPATPLRSAPAFTAGQPGFPFTYPSPQVKGKKHRRSPSEGVFTMSSDDDASPNEQSLIAFARSRAQNKPPKTPSPSLSRASATTAFNEFGNQTQSAGYFASSLFQNSPSPDELPDPVLF